MLLRLIKEKYPHTVATLYPASKIPDEFDRARANARYIEIAAIVHAQTTVLFLVGAPVPLLRPMLKMLVASNPPPDLPADLVVVGANTVTRGGVKISNITLHPDPVVRISTLIRKLKTHFKDSICAFEIVVDDMSDDFILMALLLYSTPSPAFDVTLSDANSIFSPRGLWEKEGLSFVCNYLYTAGSARVRYLYPTPGVTSTGRAWTDLLNPVLPSVQGDFYDMTVETTPQFTPSIYALDLEFVAGKRRIVDCDTLRDESLDLESVKKGPKSTGSIYWGLFDTRRVMAVVWYIQYLTGDTRPWIEDTGFEGGLLPIRPTFESRLDIRFPDAYWGPSKKQLIPGKNRLVTIPPPFKTGPTGLIYVIPIHCAGPYTDEYDFSFVTPGLRQGANNMAPTPGSPPASSSEDILGNPVSDVVDLAVKGIGGLYSTLKQKIGGTTPKSEPVKVSPPVPVPEPVVEPGPRYIDNPNPETEEEKAARRERVQKRKDAAKIERAKIDEDEKNKVKLLEEKKRKAHENVEKAKQDSLKYDYVYAWGFRYHAIVIEFEPEVEEKTRLQALAECYLYYRARFSAPSIEEVCAMHLLRARGGEVVVQEQLEIDKAECTDVEVVYTRDGFFHGTVVDPWIYYCLSRRVHGPDRVDYLKNASIFEFGDVPTLSPQAQYEPGEISVFQLSNRQVRKDETVPFMLIDRLGGWTSFGETQQLIKTHYDMLADLDWHFPTGARALMVGASFTRAAVEFHFEYAKEAKVYAKLVAERLRTPSKFIRLSRRGGPTAKYDASIALDKNVFVPLLISFENQ